MLLCSYFYFDLRICSTDSEPSFVINLPLVFTGQIFFVIWIIVCSKTMAVCVNCNIILRSDILQCEYHAVDLSQELVMIIEEWCGREITDNDQLCQECVHLTAQEANNRTANPIGIRPNSRMVICIACGISLSQRTGRRRRTLPARSDVRNYIENQIFPRQVPNEAWACNSCWMRAYHNTSRLEMEPPVSAEFEVPVVPIQTNEESILPVVPLQPNVESVPPSSSVTLPSSETESWADQMPNVQPPTDMISLSYARVSDTSVHCFVPDCVNLERLRVPRYLRRSILSRYKIYVSDNARVCYEHSMLYNWDILNEFNFIHTFNGTQIENMLELLSNSPACCVLNFEDVENTSDRLCHYWTGLTVANFLTLFHSVSQIEMICNKTKTALGMYLVKLRTGESFARMASLFLTSKGTVSNYVRKVRDCLSNYYVPLHLGVSHMTREQHSARNLLIPQGLFGTDTNNPIVICDGTYIYLQKSSNYLFQKKTYSLHKYRNLVKPFLMVTCDGHIVDAFGPYAATQSDADIMKNLFQNENSPLRSYFRQNDIFILDRGFRDAIGLLRSLGYSIHKPEGLDVGERQLSTLKANKSRMVTLCRWVVEVVNGRFKRDFKIFRTEYFNCASRNLMTDFKIAAAIINNFHPVITDNPDAESILARALERFNMPNTLADYIIEQNINRRRVNFVLIDGQLPHLDVFPVMEMRDLILFGLGIYQIKQARSYYGEHIRENGTFRIEVDTNLLEYSMNSVLLRGRIKSRHQSNKIYYTYILLNLNNSTDWCQRITKYYCSCIIGKRTVGSCAHIMTIVWYLGWARHLEVIIQPPASFLDSILVRDDVENEGYE